MFAKLSAQAGEIDSYLRLTRFASLDSFETIIVFRAIECE